MHKCRNNTELSQLGKPIQELNEYKKAVRFANDSESEEYQTVLTNIENNYNDLIPQLNDVEEQIEKYVIECRNVISAPHRKIVDITDKAKSLLPETENKKLIDNIEKEEILSSIESYENSIKELESSEVEKLKRDNDCFAKVSGLLQNQISLVQSLELVLSKIDSQTAEFEVLCLEMEYIESEYAPAFTQVLNGDYELSSQLLNN